MSTTIRLGLIGVGRWGRVIARALNDIPGARLTHLASRRSESVDSVPPGCTVTGDWRSVATAADLDGVIIASPASLHAEMAAVALDAGLAVFVEKPLAMSLQDAEGLLALARDRGGVLQVDHLDVANPAWIALKELVPGIGEITSVECRFGGPGPFRTDTPPLWDWGPHPVALCLDLLGAPIAVRTHHAISRQTELGLLQRVEFDLAFREGSTARIVTGNGFDTRERRLTVHGRESSLVYDDNAAHKLLKLDRGALLAVPIEPTLPLTRALVGFVEAIQADAPDVAGGVLGRDVVQVLARVDRQIRCLPGAAVDLTQAGQS